MAKKYQISLFGAGSLGQALVYLLALNKHQIHLYDPNRKQLNKCSQHPKLKKFTNIIYHWQLDPILFQSEIIIPCIPSHQVDKFYQTLEPKYKNNKIISVTKGFYPKTTKTISQVVKNFIPSKNFLVLSGPNFSTEILNHCPTKSIIASSNHKNFPLVKSILTTDFFQLETTDKVIATEISGIFKNCYSITLGIIDQLTHSMNTKALTINQINSEIEPLFKKLKAPDFSKSISFLGDLIATGLNPHSRNYRFGFLLTKNKQITIEGADNLQPAVAFAKNYKIKTPLLNVTEKIVNHRLSTKKILKLF